MERLRRRTAKNAYAIAGMGGIELAFEPLGAAYWYARKLKRDETVLVADFRRRHQRFLGSALF